MQRSSSIVGAYDAKAHFSALLERVAAGEEITITRHGTPIAQMVPVRKTSTISERRAAIVAIRVASKGNSLGGLHLKDLMAEGRR